MKDILLKSAFTVTIAGLTAYFNAMYIPLAILAVALICDYITGVAAAYLNKKLSSKIGFRGILRKVLSLFAVGAGMALDWLVHTLMTQAHMTMPGGSFLFGLVVIVWLIINELISILENLSEAKVPLPPFLIKMVKRLKKTVEDAVDPDNNEKDKK